MAWTREGDGHQKFHTTNAFLASMFCQGSPFSGAGGSSVTIFFQERRLRNSFQASNGI
jgi:hypothetical protein